MVKKGILKNWNNEKGYGFIDDVFCHISKFDGIIDKDKIRKGLEIEYEEEQGNKGIQVGKIISIKEEQGNEGMQNGKTKENYFMKSYIDSFDANNLEKSLSLEAFEPYKYDITGKFGIRSNRALRKIYESYLSILKGGGNDKNVKIQIWFAKVGYQESRKQSNLPKGFLKFLKSIYGDLKKKRKDYNNDFKSFLEVLISYHKLFGGKED